MKPIAWCIHKSLQKVYRDGDITASTFNGRERSQKSAWVGNRNGIRAADRAKATAPFERVPGARRNGARARS
jgi:hypothetical protein